MRIAGERQTSRSILVLMGLCFLSLPAHAQYGGGSGTADDPYQIWTAEQMNAIGAEPNDWGKHFKLMADIDLSAFDGGGGRPPFNIIAPNAGPANWMLPGQPFTGVFDGEGHTISGFSYRGTDRRSVGLFGCVAGPQAEIRNLGLADVTVENDEGQCTGGLVGYNGGAVTGCYGSGAISGQYDVGGLVGVNAGRVRRCHFSGMVGGQSRAGGLIGSSDESSEVVCCYSEGTVNARDSGAGGLIGENSGDVIDCHSSAEVGGGAWNGGLVGWNKAAIITRCYSTGAVSGAREYVGGLVGYNMPGYVSYCYSTGVVYSDIGYAGGLVGMESIGWSSGGAVSHCFWDTQTSGQAQSDGGTGRSSAQIQDIRTYLDDGWDFVGEIRNGTCELWRMPDGGGRPVQTALSGYTPPRLRGLGTPLDPYLISDARELGAVVYYSRDAHYRLTASIDLSEIRWGMAVIPRFAGTFDGNGMVISHLTVAGDRYAGLFGRLELGAQVRGLEVVDVNVGGSGDYVGALAGDSAGTITGCRSEGMVGNYGKYVGGLVGRNSGDMIDCQSDSAVSGCQDVGGLLGFNAAGRVTRCGSTGAVKWRKADDSQWAVGGLIGGNGRGVVTQCFNRGGVSGGSRYTAGLIGNNSGQVTNCYHAGEVNGTGQYVGGLVGLNGGVLTTCYSSGSVSGSGQHVGGLTGWGQASSRGGTNFVGEVVNCFWDTQRSGLSTSAGGTGRTTTEMWIASTYLNAGWDFVGETANGTEDIWWMAEGQDYPRLWWEQNEI
jgi:hypothetical protein